MEATALREGSMSKQFATLEAEALKLPPEERALLADHLLASLGEQGEVEQAWVAEIERRLSEVEAGHVELVPVEQAIQRARQALS
jgi:putative addiction module component (TIGR02574 family)